MVPLDLARAGRALSHAAFRVYIVVRSHHPEFPPSIRRICVETGFRSAAVTKALAELSAKKILTVVSGGATRIKNEYRLRDRAEWDLLAGGLGSARAKTGGRKGETVSFDETEGGGALGDHCFTGRNKTVSLGETPTVSLNEKVLDLRVRSFYIARDARSRKTGWGIAAGAARERSESAAGGQIENGEGEGGGVRPWRPDSFPTLVSGLQATVRDHHAGKINLDELERRTSELSKHFGVETHVPKPKTEKKVGKGGSAIGEPY